MATQRKSIQIDGLTGPEDEQRVESILKKLPGILTITAHYPINAVFMEYEPSLFNWDRFDRQLHRMGYTRIETTLSVTVVAPELVCPAVVNNIRSEMTRKPWIEKVQVRSKPASITISFDSRAWTEQEIVRMVGEQTLQPNSLSRW